MKHLQASIRSLQSRRFGAARNLLRPTAAWAMAAGCVILLALGPVSASAGDEDDILRYDFNPEAFRGVQHEPSSGLLGSGLFDTSRFSMSHSMSYGVSSSSYGSASGGLWTTSLGYRIADPLHLSVDMGASLATGGEALFDSRNVFLQGVNLDYRPSNRFHLSLSYRNIPEHARNGYAASRGLWSSRGLMPWDDDPFGTGERAPDRP